MENAMPLNHHLPYHRELIVFDVFAQTFALNSELNWTIAHMLKMVPI